MGNVILISSPPISEKYGVFAVIKPTLALLQVMLCPSLQWLCVGCLLFLEQHLETISYHNSLWSHH